MCLIFISVRRHPVYKLIIAANRDEFYARKTAAAHFWSDYPAILGGRDLEANGTWMGMNRNGRISFVTNYRDPANIDPNAPSRGQLVSDFLEGGMSPGAYLSALEPKAKQYNGFNLIVGNVDELWYLSNYSTGYRQLQEGFYGLSNHLLDTPWPKITRGKALLSPLLSTEIVDIEGLMNTLRDSLRATDEQLPETGIGLERERALSSMFIQTKGYGTRCSTVVLVDQHNHVTFAERVYDLTTFDYTTKTFNFVVEN